MRHEATNESPGPRWRKSSYSGGAGGNCVEVTSGTDQRLIRDSKQPEAGVLEFSAREWTAFLASARRENL
ncbi:DUF397 domain-containing protein [Streptomonospora alba]|uniref:DUF397 domain-containing protein n=1 Tax=Streptomonospora alba TaxID=183763 RepID=UPI000A02FFAC|nr:DUF397 domain-containing protein [Streptomonospora alba]